jgi:cyclic dehypoxanthinyl futalosine synthase
MRITKKKGLELFKKENVLNLGRMADEIRKTLHPEKTVTFIVDRNINYTNICINRCSFCAFWRDKGSKDAYVLSKKELFKKIKETLSLGGTQVLLQGGLHPDLDLEFYTGMLRDIKRNFDINIHGFSPPEVCHIAKMSKLTVRETLKILKDAGLDSMPGGGAEILSDKIRKILSPKKIDSSLWLKVMEEAHRLGMKTTATMMFGSIERPEDIIEHLDRVRGLQDMTGGFTAFIPWSFQPGNTRLKHIKPRTGIDYLRVLALSRLYLDNIRNIQASWVTQGIKLAQVALRFGANDMGSTMIEENVVSSTGVSHMTSKADIIRAIKDAGFDAAQRDTYYKIIKNY